MQDKFLQWLECDTWYPVSHCMQAGRHAAAQISQREICAAKQAVCRTTKGKDDPALRYRCPNTFVWADFTWDTMRNTWQSKLWSVVSNNFLCGDCQRGARIIWNCLQSSAGEQQWTQHWGVIISAYKAWSVECMLATYNFLSMPFKRWLELYVPWTSEMQNCKMQRCFSDRNWSGKSGCAIRSLGNVWKNEWHFTKMQNFHKLIMFLCFHSEHEAECKIFMKLS